MRLWVCSCLHSVKMVVWILVYGSSTSVSLVIAQCTCLKHLGKRNYYLHLAHQPKCVYITKSSTTLPSVLLSLLLTHLEFQSKELVTQSFCSSYLPTYLTIHEPLKKALKINMCKRYPFHYYLGLHKTSRKCAKV